MPPNRIQMRDALTHVAALPQAQREAIFLTVIDGHSHEEVASALGITHGAVRGLLRNELESLRQNIVWKIFPLCDPDGVARGGQAPSGDLQPERYRRLGDEQAALQRVGDRPLPD